VAVVILHVYKSEMRNKDISSLHAKLNFMLLSAVLTNYVLENDPKQLRTPDRRSVTLEFFKNRVEDSVLLLCYVTSAVNTYRRSKDRCAIIFRVQQSK
jgi:hypothetical protein